ncbi:MAG: hypothetical protein WDM96_15295 [Lacunisphaera sp.]
MPLKKGAREVAPAAAKLVDFGNGWAITNSMATGWAVSALLVALIIYAVRKPKVMPTKSQAVFESLLEALRDLLEPIVGKKAFPFAFPLLVSFFHFHPVPQLDGPDSRRRHDRLGPRGGGALPSD